MEETLRELALGRLARIVLAEVNGKREKATFPVGLQYEIIFHIVVIDRTLYNMNKSTDSSEKHCLVAKAEEMTHVQVFKMHYCFTNCP